ncbi:hypothetical protein CROQUDRAFT_656525 [Cronartium quercuum f. sp. fusiforme G11]|uniref:CCR4-Not complex 3'-5'-exoribonuclease subunit Ccr4 n=1 Tax=Cronartium quercuum f. sp. fusiforme G11 TaxID=708437 RepID=A0A9P6TDT3_9BASI|nr:hypothetical protein CROQUDRAFT_656525 [Cronartium quercuum f. sp. fusiforme G11]
MYHPPNGHLPPPGGPGRWQSNQLIKQLAHYPPHHQQQHHQHQHQHQQHQHQHQHHPHPHHSHQHSSSFTYATHHPPTLASATSTPASYPSHPSQNPHPAYLPSPGPGHPTAPNPIGPPSAHHPSSQPHQPVPPLTPSGPITPSWAKQVEHAQISRASGAAHHHARAAQLQSRGQGSSALTITDPNRPSKPITTYGALSSALPIASRNRDTNMDSMNTTEGFRSHSVNSMSSGTVSSKEKVDPSSPSETSVTTSSSVTANVPERGSQKTTGGCPGQSWTTVDMGGLKLKSLSDALFNYDFLTTLYIPHNSLTSLPPLISRLTSLTILDVSSNKLTALPAELGMLTTLQHLFVFDNHLTSLPPELGSLHQLEELGVEGNPLADALLTTIQKEGTPSLVAYLRDSCPVPLPPSERDWIAIEPECALLSELPSAASLEGTAAAETFTMMCYNILCERYATDRMYGYTPSWALNWDYRKDLILQELMQYGADVICLQEVDVEQYEDFFVQSLKDQGYEGVFYPKSRARTMGSEERRHVDGCATFFKTSIFQLIERECVEFNQIPMRSESHKTEDMFNRVMTKDNIAVIAMLEHRRSGARQLVANVHIHWDPEFRDVKLIQTAMLIEQVGALADRFAKLPPRSHTSSGVPAPRYSSGVEIPIIVCGDFNSVPSSGVYDYLSSGSLEPTHDDFATHHYGPYTTHGVRHGLALRSAYSHLGELPFTNYTPGFKGVIDYIFYSTGSLAVTGLLGKIDETYLDKVVGFPNAHFASDHVPVLAEFKLKPVQSR